jgi:two-component system sensor histidine kinase KdpD
MLVLLAITTVINYNFFSTLGITGVTLLSLLVVVTAAYCCEFIVATSTAFMAFLAINYFFTEPRYTFEVAHVESLASLICFLIVSMVITSLVKQLKFQTLQASIATKHAQFARTLAENLSLATDVKSLLQDTCKLLQAEFDKPFAIALTRTAQTNNDYSINSQSSTMEMPDRRLLNWVSANGKPISPYTDYWSHCAYWLIPFSRLPNQNPSIDPILVVGNIDNEDSQGGSVEMYTVIKSCVDQISLAYQRLTNIERTKHAELMAQTEAIQSALLASISHDMRTPLTSILGAATTLQQPNLAPEQAMHLSSLIASQARYLASTTENILSLIRLESNAVAQIPMDWQSPEEIIGVVTALYKNRGEKIDLKVTVSEPELLIKGNANLLTQALVNLIDNAKQANLNNHPIEIDVSKTNERINISVNDRGNGFSETFNTSQIKKFSSSNTKGFGLGLSIVQAIAKSHDAIFTINNRDGGGACATLSFNAPDVGNIDV